MMDLPAQRPGKAYTIDKMKNLPTLYLRAPGNAKPWSDLPNDPPNDTNSCLPAGSLDFLLAGYSGNLPNNQHIQQQQINSNSALMSTDNPDGPLASQESAMFMKPAQLAKDEKVLRIIDFVDKIVTSTEDKTITDLGSTKLVISSGPKKPKLQSL